MAENDNGKKPQNSRSQQRPLPGVQKAINIFGVSDLRQLLDKKHKEHDGESQEEKPIDPKKIPPPDPSYNYLRDPARDEPRATQPHGRGNNRKPQVSRPKNNENITEETPTLDNENVKTSNFRGRQPRRGNSNQTTFELVDNANETKFRGSPRRGRGKPRNKDHPEIINEFLNIKVEVSSETGQRSCVLDEDTKIANIKHVPDHQSPRRGRGSFRGRGRGRGNYRGRGGFFNNKNTDNDNNKVPGNDNELPSEFHYDSEEQAQQTTSIDSNLAETITVTSSKFQDDERLENDENSEENINTSG